MFSRPLFLLLLLHVSQSIPLNCQTNLTYRGTAHCTHSVGWAGRGYHEYDCVDAIARLQHTDYTLYGQTKFEFLGPGARAVYGLPVFWTPGRYTVGTCTVVIAMLNSFPPDLLPEEPARVPYGFSDVASFADLWAAARRVDHLCVGAQEALGWATGETANHAMGVFVWATGSAMDRIVPPRGGLRVASNGTASSVLAGSR